MHAGREQSSPFGRNPLMQETRPVAPQTMSPAAACAGLTDLDCQCRRRCGDEFAVLVHTLDPTSEAKSIANRKHEVLSAPFDQDEHRVDIGTNIGIAIASADASHPDELMKRADVALYRAKQGDGDCLRFFELAMEQRQPAQDAQPRASAA